MVGVSMYANKHASNARCILEKGTHIYKYKNPNARIINNLHLTEWRTRLSRGLRFGSFVEERIPVPQLLARVLLQEHKTSRLKSTLNTLKQPRNYSKVPFSKKYFCGP